jgi:hypothetical protein
LVCVCVTDVEIEGAQEHLDLERFGLSERNALHPLLVYWGVCLSVK